MDLQDIVIDNLVGEVDGDIVRLQDVDGSEVSLEGSDLFRVSGEATPTGLKIYLLGGSLVLSLDGYRALLQHFGYSLATVPLLESVGNVDGTAALLVWL